MKALIYLLPGPPRKKDEHGPHRIEKMLQYIEYTNNVMKKTKEIAEGLKEFPPLIICATTGNVPVKYYLVIFEAIFCFDSFVGSLDMLFKTFFALNLKYPSQLRSTYTFIQKFFYRINLQEDPNLANVIRLINELDHSRL